MHLLEPSTWWEACFKHGGKVDNISTISPNNSDYSRTSETTKEKKEQIVLDEHIFRHTSAFKWHFTVGLLEILKSYELIEVDVSPTLERLTLRKKKLLFTNMQNIWDFVFLKYCISSAILVHLEYL